MTPREIRFGRAKATTEVGRNTKTDVRKRAVYEKIVNRSKCIMTEAQAQSFGQMLKARRKDLGLERKATAEAADMNTASLYRLEHGQFLNPDPTKLEALAKILRLKLTDVLTAAGYPATRGLPEPGPYLRAKYRNLPPHQLAALDREVTDLLHRYGVSGDERPRQGEDESDEAGDPVGGRP